MCVALFDGQMSMSARAIDGILQARQQVCKAHKEKLVSKLYPDLKLYQLTQDDQEYVLQKAGKLEPNPIKEAYKKKFDVSSASEEDTDSPPSKQARLAKAERSRRALLRKYNSRKEAIWPLLDDNGQKASPEFGNCGGCYKAGRIGESCESCMEDFYYKMVLVGSSAGNCEKYFDAIFLSLMVGKGEPVSRPQQPRLEIPSEEPQVHIFDIESDAMRTVEEIDEERVQALVDQEDD